MRWKPEMDRYAWRMGFDRTGEESKLRVLQEALEQAQHGTRLKSDDASQSVADEMETVLARTKKLLPHRDRVKTDMSKYR